MASVTHINTTGDNDPEIFPVRYVNHYLYCDNCGSFELQYDFAPNNHAELAARRDRSNRVARLALIACLVLLLPSLFLLGIPVIVSFAVFLIAKVNAVRLDSRIDITGLVCKQCGTQYAHGSDFFTNLESNPRSYTMDDVPRPEHLVKQVRGSTLGPAEES